jgi:hypothetical protein
MIHVRINGPMRENEIGTFRFSSLSGRPLECEIRPLTEALQSLNFRLARHDHNHVHLRPTSVARQ